MPTNFIELGDTLKNAAAAITGRISSDNSLNFNAKQLLSRQAQALILKSKSLYAQAVVEVADNVTNSIKGLVDAESQIQITISTISNVQKVVTIATSLVNVAENILTGNYTGAVANAESVLAGI